MKNVETMAGRRRFVVGVFTLVAVILTWRAVDLQLLNNTAYQDKGEATHIKSIVMTAHRGMIKDRNGDPLAVTTPVESVWANPKVLLAQQSRLPELARLLSVDVKALEHQLRKRAEREFVFLKRRVNPMTAEKVKVANIPGVDLQREYRRFYPTGEISSTLLGFTNIDDAGQEGVEFHFDDQLSGEHGSKRVLQDRHGRALADVEQIRAPQQGLDLTLSIDRRIQYLAYRELKAAVEKHNADSGSMVVLDVLTGEILAMVNQPSFNPNEITRLRKSGGRSIRNRAVTDVFEPGSTIKPFTVVAAMQAGVVKAHDTFNTAPGFMHVGRHRIQDVHNYGVLDVAGVLRKSSNIGVTAMALQTDRAVLWQRLHDVGFGVSTRSGIPGEQSGRLRDYKSWREIDQATLAFGYGLATNVLQLARAYLVLADDGRYKPITLLKQESPPASTQVLNADIVRRVRGMMEGVVSSDGTAPLAAIPAYRVAGKTGTVRKHIQGGGYATDQHLALFAGIVPATQPRLVGVILVDHPRGKDYFGGQVAAPVFARVMAGALRLLDVAPDAPPDEAGAVHLAAANSAFGVRPQLQ